MKHLAMAVALAALLTASNGTATLPPCPTEDSVSCHWQATTDGNGRGQSFDVDAHGNVTYTR